jgi:hypothetical protein
VSLSPRTIMEMLGTAVLTGLLIWQTLTAAGLRTQVARLETSVQKDQLVIQAKDVTAKSCQAALTVSSAATAALHDATTVAYAQADKALQRAQDRNQAVSKDVTRLLSVRPAAGQDCQTATGLARAAWEEGQ